MANIRLDLDHELLHGEELVFKAPCDCTAVSGIKVYYPSTSGMVSKTLIFKDAHGNVLTNINNLFSSGVLIKVLVDSTDGYAYILNADTNAYLEAKITPVDNLESDRADLSLSAKQGKAVKNLINVRYNEATDNVEIFYNGVWNPWKPSGMQKFDFISDTILSDWTRSNISQKYDSSGTVPTLTFTGGSMDYNASTTHGSENCKATCKVPVMIKKGDKLKVTCTGSDTGGNWSSLVAGTDGVNFPYVIFGGMNQKMGAKEYDLTQYAGSELYFRYTIRAATIQPVATFTRFEIGQ